MAQALPLREGSARSVAQCHANRAEQRRVQLVPQSRRVQISRFSESIRRNGLNVNLILIGGEGLRKRIALSRVKEKYAVTRGEVHVNEPSRAQKGETIFARDFLSNGLVEADLKLTSFPTR
jgi:hypothetical protein